jgi:hypothetical protein
MSPTYAVTATVATTGTVDPNDVAKVVFNNGVARLKSGLPVGTQAVIRYNLVLSPTFRERYVDALFSGSWTSPEMGVRFYDNGSGSRIFIDLKAYDVNTGMTTTVVTFDSDVFPAHSQFQVQWIYRVPLGWYWDFDNKSYFLEARLIKAGTGGDPGLGIIRLRSHGF